MRILGFDTATWTASLGVVQDGAVLGERAQAAAPSHSFSLIPRIEDTLDAARVRLSDLGSVA